MNAERMWGIEFDGVFYNVCQQKKCGCQQGLSNKSFSLFILCIFNSLLLWICYKQIAEFCSAMCKRFVSILAWSMD